MNNTTDIAGTITPLSGSASESFATAFFNNLFSKITTWLADAGNGIGNIFANRVRTKEICVSDNSGTETCVDKNQLDALLQKNNIGNSNSASVINNTGSPTATPDSVPTPTSNTSPTPTTAPSTANSNTTSDTTSSTSISSTTDSGTSTPTSEETPAPEPAPEIIAEPTP